MDPMLWDRYFGQFKFRFQGFGFGGLGRVLRVQVMLLLLRLRIAPGSLLLIFVHRFNTPKSTTLLRLQELDADMGP